MNAVCVDASLALSWLLVDRHTPDADRLWREWANHSVQMLGPAMFRAEVISALRKHVFFRQLLPEEGESLLVVYEGIPIQIVDGPEVYRRAWQLAQEFNQPVCYDMLYLAVAEIEDCDFWTADQKLVNSLQGRNRHLRWIGEA